MLYKTTSVIIGIPTDRLHTEALQLKLSRVFTDYSQHIEQIHEDSNRKYLKDLSFFSVITAENKRSQLIEQLINSGFEIHYLSNKKIWEEENQKIKLPSANGFKFFPLHSILRFESCSNYTYVHFTTQKRILIAKPLIQLEEKLSSSGFFRVHHKHLINTAHIVEYRSGKGGTVVLSDNSSVEVSVRKKKHFMNYLNRSLDKLNTY